MSDYKGRRGVVNPSSLISSDLNPLVQSNVLSAILESTQYGARDNQGSMATMASRDSPELSMKQIEERQRMLGKVNHGKITHAERRSDARISRVQDRSLQSAKKQASQRSEKRKRQKASWERVPATGWREESNWRHSPSKTQTCLQSDSSQGQSLQRPDSLLSDPYQHRLSHSHLPLVHENDPSPLRYFTPAMRPPKQSLLGEYVEEQLPARLPHALPSFPELEWPFQGPLFMAASKHGGGGGSQPSTTGTQGFPQFVTAGPETTMFGHNLFGYDREEIILWA